MNSRFAILSEKTLRRKMAVIFLWLAFGSLDFLAGQIVGKAWMVLLSIPFVTWLRRRDAQLGLAPA